MSLVAPALARHWRSEGESVVCTLCPHECRLQDGDIGLCGVRRNLDGRLVTDVYGLAVAARPAPIERKFLYHVAPGTLTYSLAAPGCNLRCAYCQNWMVSQMPKGRDHRLEGRALPPEQVVAEAMEQGCQAVACTYTEPTIFLEYAVDIARLAHERGLRVVWKTNGYTSPAALAEIVPLLDAVNVDLKSFRDETYRHLCGGRLEPVLETIRAYRDAGVWIELTTLVIPDLTDDPDELDAIGSFILDELGPATPWHLTQFHPDHELRDRPRTPADSLEQARERALDAGLRHVYSDARTSGPGWHTCCPSCGEVLIERANYELVADRRRDGACPACGAVWADGVGL